MTSVAAIGPAPLRRERTGTPEYESPQQLPLRGSDVAIYDHERQLDSGGRFYFLAPGDRFNLKTREASRMELMPRPLGRVEERPWR